MSREDVLQNLCKEVGAAITKANREPGVVVSGIDVNLLNESNAVRGVEIVVRFRENPQDEGQEWQYIWAEGPDV